jgi:peptidoglycan/LPS O-acetylase OafA/YrhL
MGQSARTLKMAVFWKVALRSLVKIDRRFGDAYCLHHQGATSRKTAVFILVAVRTWTLTYEKFSYLVCWISVMFSLRENVYVVPASDTQQALCNRVLFVGSVTKLYQTANLTYIQSLHRATSYMVGVGLGFLLHKTGKHVHIPKVSVFTHGNKHIADITE